MKFLNIFDAFRKNSPEEIRIKYQEAGIPIAITKNYDHEKGEYTVTGIIHESFLCSYDGNNGFDTRQR